MKQLLAIIFTAGLSLVVAAAEAVSLTSAIPSVKEKITVTKENNVIVADFSGGDCGVRFPLPVHDLTEYNVIKFKVRLSKPLTDITSMILYCPGERSIFSLTRLGESERDLPAGRWIDCDWHFKAFPGWVTGKTNTFNYTNVSALEFFVGARFMPEGGVKFEFADMRLTAEPPPPSIAQSQDFKDFVKDFKIPQGKKKRILWLDTRRACSGGMANFAFLAKDGNLDKVKEYPVDGVICEPLPFPFRDDITTENMYPQQVFDDAIALGKTLDFGKLKENFLRIDMVAGWKDADGNRVPLDWFNDKIFEAAAYKIGQVARIARELGFQGIMMDNECYAQYPYDYYMKYSSKGTFTAYSRKVRERGAAMMKAMVEQFPDIKFMVLFNNWHLHTIAQQDRYGLWPSFLDGLISETNGTATIIDGAELYELHSDEQFLLGRYDMDVRSPALSAFPYTYRKYVQSGFGTWCRADRHTLPQYQEMLRGAEKYTDEYVWIYTDQSVFEDKRMIDLLTNLDK